MWVESAETRLLVAKYNETHLGCSLMIKLPLHNNCFSIQKTRFQKKKDFAKTSVTWLYRIVDIIVSITAKNHFIWLSILVQTDRKLYPQIIKDSVKICIEEFVSVSMIHNLAEIRVTYNLWKKKSYPRWLVIWYSS